MANQEEMKKSAAKHAAALVQNGATIGLGTGSTVYWLIHELAEKVKTGFKIKVVPTSRQSEKLATEAGLEVVNLDDVETLDLAIDGADEINPHFALIKGGGGALLREKMIAFATHHFYVIADESKLVHLLGKFPVPVEVVKFGWKHIAKKIENYGCTSVQLRKTGEEIYETDNGNYILDCHFEKIYGATELNLTLQVIPGVVETGLFVGLTRKLIIGFADGQVREFDNYLLK